MKKNELINIIRESIKELMNEGPQPSMEGLRGMDRKGKVIKKEQMVKRQVKKGMARKGMTAEVTKPLRRNKTSRVRNKNIKF